MIGPLLRDGDGDWTAPYAYTGGGAYTKTRALRRDASALMLFIDFADMVVRDGIDPLVAHRAFMAVDEYREGVAEDTAAIGVNGQGRPRTGRGRACDWQSPYGEHFLKPEAARLGAAIGLARSLFERGASRTPRPTSSPRQQQCRSTQNIEGWKAEAPEPPH